MGKVVLLHGPFDVASIATWFETLSGKRCTVLDIRHCEFSNEALESVVLWNLFRIVDIGTRGPKCEPGEEEKFWS